MGVYQVGEKFVVRIDKVFESLEKEPLYLLNASAEKKREDWNESDGILISQSLLERCAKYDTVHLLEEFSKEYTNIQDLLAPVKVLMALKGELMILEVNHEQEPESANVLAYTIIAALKNALPVNKLNSGACPICGHFFNENENYCPICGQRVKKN